MGSHNQLITRGFGGIFQAIVNGFRRIIFGGGAERRRKEYEERQEVIVGARLLKINDQEPVQVTEGIVRASANQKNTFKILSEHISSRVKSAWDNLFIDAKLVKSTGLGEKHGSVHDGRSITFRSRRKK